MGVLANNVLGDVCKEVIDEIEQDFKNKQLVLYIRDKVKDGAWLI